MSQSDIRITNSRKSNNLINNKLVMEEKHFRSIGFFKFI